MKSGDGYIQCDQGHTHWGKYGAAGILFRSSIGDHNFYFLVNRLPSLIQNIESYTWSIPGGAIDKNESAFDAALREFYEECYGEPVIDNVKTLSVNDHGKWKYTTFLVDTNTPMGIKDRQEHNLSAWMTKKEIDQINYLHPGFQETWNLYSDQL
jgi:ADP-ribose pyrophosphatase YjhB (NUDIX family)